MEDAFIVLRCAATTHRRRPFSPRRHTAAKWISFSLKQFFFFFCLVLFSLVPNFVYVRLVKCIFLHKTLHRHEMYAGIWVRYRIRSVGIQLHFALHVRCAAHTPLGESRELDSDVVTPNNIFTTSSCHTGYKLQAMDVVTPVYSLAWKRSFGLRQHALCIILHLSEPLIQRYRCLRYDWHRPGLLWYTCCIVYLVSEWNRLKYMYGVHVKRGERVFASVASVYVRFRYIYIHIIFKRVAIV